MWTLRGCIAASTHANNKACPFSKLIFQKLANIPLNLLKFDLFLENVDGTTDPHKHAQACGCCFRKLRHISQIGHATPACQDHFKGLFGIPEGLPHPLPAGQCIEYGALDAGCFRRWRYSGPISEWWRYSFEPP